MDVIEGVSIISIGEAKGHGLYVDETTLMQVKECAESYKGGVKVNLDHGAGIKDIVGFVNNFRIVGKQLLGDLNLLETSPMRFARSGRSSVYLKLTTTSRLNWFAT